MSANKNQFLQKFEFLLFFENSRSSQGKITPSIEPRNGELWFHQTEQKMALPEAIRKSGKLLKTLPQFNVPKHVFLCYK
jgi:hypothetical protein